MTVLRAHPRWIAGLVAAAVVLGCLALVGRWERNRNIHSQNARMEAVYRAATSNGIISPRLTAYRLDWTFDCLLYRPSSHPNYTSAFELCFDPHGRLVETIDRSSGTPVFGDLHAEPTASAVRVPVPKLLAAFKALGAFKDPRFVGVRLDQSTLPVHFNDIGIVMPPPSKGG